LRQAEIKVCVYKNRVRSVKHIVAEVI